ncbi:MAG: polysaccharide deacetylase family protein [Candidatus Omnitrophica bacterium]|nr:polysaccharide deacetylase family protein [Candidatus Omnitrophota bacterium]
MIRIRKKFILGFILAVGLLVTRDFFYEVPIITYHQIKDVCPKDSLLCVTEKSFKKQMEFIFRYNYKVISPEELYLSLIRKKPIPKRAVLISFDDGTDDFYKYAFKTLKEYKFPAVVFIICDYINKEGYLHQKELKEIRNYNITIGSHTRTHRYLGDTYDEAILQEEIYGSKKILEEILGEKIYFLAYPLGGYNDKVKTIVKDAGYRLAFTTNRAGYKRNPDIFALRRIKMTEDSDNFFVLWPKLSGLYNLLRKG